MGLTDFTVSNARRFYSSMGSPSGVKGLTTSASKAMSLLTEGLCSKRGSGKTVPMDWMPFPQHSHKRAYFYSTSSRENKLP